MKWQDFDFDGKVKIPLGFYLVMLYLLRGYVTWVISLTYREDTSLLLSMAYSESHFFYLSMIVGLPAVIVQTLFALKKQVEKPWFKRFWVKSYWLLTIALFADLIIQLQQIINASGLVHGFNILMLVVGVYLTWYWISSNKIKRFFTNWIAQ